MVERHKRLTFKTRYVEPIRLGRKTQTLRRGMHESYRLGDVVEAKVHWSRPPFALLKITAVDRITLGDVSAADARADGFASLAELRRAWNATNPKHQWAADQPAIRITYRVEEWMQ